MNKKRGWRKQARRGEKMEEEENKELGEKMRGVENKTRGEKMMRRERKKILD